MKFVCWVKRHGRAEDLATVFNWDLHYVWPHSEGPFGKPLRYIRSIKPSRELLNGQPLTAALMLPPPFAILALPGKGVKRRVIDIHSGLITDRRWRPFLRYCFSQVKARDLILAHNETDAEFYAQYCDAQVAILQDPILTAERLRHNGRTQALTHGLNSTISVLFPSSGDSDEPLGLFRQALAMSPPLPRERIVITGQAARRLGYGNLATTPGFIEPKSYDAVARSADVIVALSTRGNIIQRAAFETLITGARPLLSESTALRKVFGPYAEYVDPLSPRSMRDGLARAIARNRPAPQELQDLRMTVEREEHRQISAVTNILNDFDQ